MATNKRRTATKRVSIKLMKNRVFGAKKTPAPIFSADRHNGGGIGAGQVAQDIQDEIFRKMPADRKIELGSRLWLLAKELTKEKSFYGNNRPKTFTGKGR